RGACGERRGRAVRRVRPGGRRQRRIDAGDDDRARGGPQVTTRRAAARDSGRDMTALYLLHDEVANDLMPFALTRPASELRVGAMLVRQRWERALGMPAAGLIVAPHLRDFEEQNAPPVISATVPAGSVLANARCAVALSGVSADADIWSCDGQIAAVRLDRDLSADEIG